MRQKFVFIPAEKPLLRYEDWDPVREQSQAVNERDDAAFAAQLRDYAQRAAVYAARGLMKNASTATDREWFEAVVSRVRQVAALEQSGRPRTIDELHQQQSILQQCYTELAVLLLAWSVVVEARECGFVGQEPSGCSTSKDAAPGKS
jgi:hypothetical protein